MDERKERLMEAITERIKPEVIQEENEALKAQYMEVKARAEHFEEMVKRLEVEKEKAYLQGRIDGLEFLIRCNGVSGNIAKLTKIVLNTSSLKSAKYADQIILLYGCCLREQ